MCINIDAALDQYEYECWCGYNHEHKDQHGNWAEDEQEKE